MNITSKNKTRIILAVVSLILSRAVFFYINDPEGPNLVVVVGLAIIIFAILTAIYYVWHRR